MFAAAAPDVQDKRGRQAIPGHGLPTVRVGAAAYCAVSRTECEYFLNSATWGDLAAGVAARETVQNGAKRFSPSESFFAMFTRTLRSETGVPSRKR